MSLSIEPNQEVAALRFPGLNLAVPTILADQELTVIVEWALNPQDATKFWILLGHSTTQDKTITPIYRELQSNGSLVKGRKATPWIANLGAIVRHKRA